MHRFVAVLVVFACSMVIGACGGSAKKDPYDGISAQDRAAAARLIQAERAWERAYGAWDTTFRALESHRSLALSAFLRTVGTTLPQSGAPEPISYLNERDAASVDDPGLRSQYVKLARSYFAQARAARRVTDYVENSRRWNIDWTHIAPHVKHLDRVQSRRLRLAEQFQNYFQQRFGINPANVP